MSSYTKKTAFPDTILEEGVDLSGEAAITAEPLRLLFVVDSFLPGVGGAEIQAVKLGRALSDKGVSVEFVAPRLHREWPIEHTIDGMKVTKIDYPKIRLIGSAVLIFKFAIFLLQRRNQFDAVHIHVTSKLASMAGLLRPLINTRMVAKISGYFEFEEGVLRPGTSFNPIHIFNKAGLSRLDYFQTISQQTREKLIEAGYREEQIQYIPNGITPTVETKSRQPNTDRDFVIGYCGRLREVKGVEVLIGAFAELLNVHGIKNVRLSIAGDGPTLPDLEAQVAKFGIADRVEFLGMIEDSDEFMSSLDLYVQPSFAEGLPNSVIEAMNGGCPIVATDIGGNRDLVEPGKNGFLVPAGDSKAMATALVQAIELGEGLTELGLASHEIVVQGFSFNSVTCSLMELYRS